MSSLPTDKLTLKLYAEAATFPPISAFVEVFHAWIKASTSGEPMIDVADYAHVHDGPSVLFCGHESDYVIDAGEGRVGLLYRRKRAPAVDPRSDGGDERLTDSLRRMLAAAEKLEAEPKLAGLRFDRNEMQIVLVDRLRAPNDAETFARLKPAIEATLATTVGPMSVSFDDTDPRRPLTLRAHCAT